MECPFVKRDFVPDPNFNKAIDYADLGGNQHYVFYDHDDGFGKITCVQFCQLIGRKRDVFECLNENEWYACPHYQAAVAWEKAHERQDERVT